MSGSGDNRLEIDFGYKPDNIETFDVIRLITGQCIPPEESLGSNIPGQSRKIHDEMLRIQVFPNVAINGLVIDKNIGERSRGVSNITDAAERTKQLSDQAVDDGGFDFFLWRLSPSSRRARFPPVLIEA